MQTQAVTQQRVGEVGPSIEGEGEGAAKPPQRLAPFPGNCCFFFVSLHNVAITVSKARSTFASLRPPKSTPTKSTGATRRGGGRKRRQPPPLLRLQLLLLLPLYGRPLPQRSVVSAWPTFLR